MSTPALAAKIDDIPNDGEWWRLGGRRDFLELADQLVEGGFSEDEAVGILTRAYAAVAAEFGN